MPIVEEDLLMASLLEEKQRNLLRNSNYKSMRIDILSILPQLIESPLSDSIMQRAQDKGCIEIHLHDIRKYSLDKHHRVDDYQYGGGAGMVMSVEPIANLIDKLKQERSYDEVIYMSNGDLLNQTCNQLSLYKNLIILCGHYKGVDERIREHYITKEISIGSYVLSWRISCCSFNRCDNKTFARGTKYEILP